MSLVNYAPTHVKFVSYTGKYPNLCRGVLILEIDGVPYGFGHDYSKYGSWKTDGNYDSFWTPGGGCGFNEDYSESYVSSAPWEIDVSSLPEKLRPFAAEIDMVFNDNVPHGCCGGCL
ncbi:MAG: hypothetical protein OSJ43_06720 [Oscillospiraceae bacterium]|nr:hypothetical protein [Oscillospiraceae bacterium]